MRGALTLLALLWSAAPALAQTQRAAVVVEWDADGMTTMRETVRANVMARGFEVMPNEAIDAARAFSGSTGPLDAASAAALRQRLDAHYLVWVSAQPQGERVLVAVRRVAEAGTTQAFGAASEPEVYARVVTLIDEAWGAAPQPPASPAPVAPPVVAPPIVAPPVVAPAVVAPPRTVGPVVAPAPAIAPVTAPVTAPAPAPAPEPAAVPGTAVESIPTSTSEPEPESLTERVRFAVVAYAGPEAYGYGIGFRLELPFGGVIGGVDDSFGMGLDLGFGYVDLNLDDQGNGVSAFQMPGSAYFTWRFRADDVEIGPRLGGVLALRAGEWRGPRVSGGRISLVGMGLVGISLGIQVADGVQIYGGLDLAIGERVSGIISAGVAF